MELAWIVGQRLAAAPARESVLLVQTPTFPPWGPAGDPAALLLQEAGPEELHSRPGLGALLSPQLGAARHPCRDCHRAQSHDASPRVADHRLPKGGSGGLHDPWKERGGVPPWRWEELGARRTWDRKEEDHGDRCQLPQGRHEDLGTEGAVGAPAGVWGAASGPWPRQEPPLPLLQGAASLSTEGPEPPSRSGWALLGGLSSSEEERPPPATPFGAQGTQGPSPPGAQLLTEDGGASRTVQCPEETHTSSGPALLLPEGPHRPGDEGRREEGVRALHLEGSGPGCSEVPEEPGSEEWEAEEMLFLVEESSLPSSLRLALSPEGTEPTSPPGAPRRGHGPSALRRDPFDKELGACFQHLSVLRLGSGLPGPETSVWAGENWSFAQRWHSCREHACPRPGLANQRFDTCPAKEADPKESEDAVRPGETEAPGTGHVLPWAEPGVEDLSRDLQEASAQGRSWRSRPPGALEGHRESFHPLLSGWKEERSRILHANAELQRDQERSHKKIRALEKERDRHADRIASLEQDNGALLGDVARLQQEVGQYLQVIADLEDCNGQSYCRISELEEENEKLKGLAGQLHRAVSEGAGGARGAVGDVARENRELKALVSELGLSYKELLKDVVLGIEETVRAFRGENQHLLHRIQVLERGVGLGMTADLGPGKSEVAVDQADGAEQGVQATQLSEPPATRAPGPPLEEGMGPAGWGLGPSLGTENSRNGAGPTAPSSVGRHGDVPSAPHGEVGGGQGTEARLEQEARRPWRSADPAPALRPLSNGPQVGGRCVAVSSSSG